MLTVGAGAAGVATWQMMFDDPKADALLGVNGAWAAPVGIIGALVGVAGPIIGNATDGGVEHTGGGTDADSRKKWGGSRDPNEGMFSSW